MKIHHSLSSTILACSVFLGSTALAQNAPQANLDAQQNQLDFRTSDEFGFALSQIQGASDKLTVIDVQRRFKSWTEILGELFSSSLFEEAMEEEGFEGELPEIDLLKSLQLFGLHNLTTYAHGVEETGDGWIQRSFLGLDGEAKGVIALGGVENAPWQATQLARKDDDLILEFTLDAAHLGRWLLESMELFSESIPPEMLEEMAEEGMGEAAPMALAFTDPSMLNEPIMPDGQSILEFLNSVGQPRFSLIVNLPPGEILPELLYDMFEQEEFMPFLEAGGSLTLAIDESEALLKLIEPQFAQMGAETVEEDGVFITRFIDEETREMAGLPQGFLAQLSYNERTTSTLIELGKASAEARGSIQQSADFAASTKNFPEEGSFLSWVSKDFIDSIYSVIELAVSEDEEAEAAMGAMMPLFSQIYGLPPAGGKQGVAAASSWLEGGIFTIASSPNPPADSFMSNAAVIPVLAAISIPATTAVIQKARSAEATSHGRSLALALTAHSVEEGEYPETLEDLFTKGYLDEGGRRLLELNRGGEWNYRQVLPTAPADTVMLWARLHSDGYLSVNKSGEVQEFTAAEFFEFAEEQGLEVEDMELEMDEEDGADFGQFF